ncbi:helical backbone metal receptor [Yinghuangia sp. ASG 101]|uniref:helical backbone metal receptor n=1 Tax=Yinghuangia sp. ASG 101 TaxID=2896848 RepID=UPI001E295A68|nr:helical backbone metal receptor [Yinghuangia sp. ASG 101]UGQ10397.1 helical backbone metal receptor [Yinghuangia sp. ASG 101]
MNAPDPDRSGPTDDLGLHVPVPSEVRRVVSLVPSLTEAIAATRPGLVVGATDWCSHPADLDVTRVRGTKNPDIDAITGLAPDLVVANEEENRVPDLDALRAAGIPVWVTRVRTLPEAFTSLERLLTIACRLPAPAWLDAARRAWADADAASWPSRTAVIPIWRRPWMVVGRDTFAGDLLARFGITNLYAEHPDRYPRIPLDDLLATRPDLVVLPDEPYVFTADDGPESFPGVRPVLLSGRHLTWYGPSLASAPEVIAAALHA